jgi:hypothetical protein
MISFRRSLTYARTALAAAVLTLFWLLIPALAADMPGTEVWLPEAEVKDRFFSYLIGLVQVDSCGVLDSAHLQSVLDDFRGKTSIPFEKITDIRRECASDSGPREVSIAFREELKTAVPYSILGYHPGSVQASRTVRFFEWDIPAKTLRWSRKEPIELTDIYVFGIYEGWTVVDIDAWLDKLLGSLLDDTRIITLVLFKYNGDWHGLAAGYGPSGEGRSGIFNFSENQILFPTPQELRMLGPYFRNFVTRVNGVDVPLPPLSKWKDGG